ncbi:MAG: hypothetical protein V2B15_05390 [Bacteroidota bacterium]
MRIGGIIQKYRLTGDVYDHLAVEYEYPNEVRIQYIGSRIDGYPLRGDESMDISMIYSPLTGF